MADFVCITECYYHEHNFKVGEPLPEGVTPNKHFMDSKSKLKTVGVLRPIVAGDDPRPTSKIIEEVNEKYNVDVDKDTIRKDVFALWVKLEKDQPHEQPIAKGEEFKKVNSLGAEVTTVKPLSSWTPDEIDKAKAGELSKAFGLPYQGKSKEDLVAEIIKAEAI